MLSTRDTDAGTYNVECEDNGVNQDGYTASSSAVCGYTWAKTDLAFGNHTVVVTVLGQSPSAPAGSAGSFELNSFT
jgi:hypothetical protein